MKFYGAAAVVLHCPLLWPLRGFPHFEHVYVFRLQVASFAAGWTIDCSSASVQEKINWDYHRTVSAFQLDSQASDQGNCHLRTHLPLTKKSPFLSLINLITATRTQWLIILINYLIHSFSYSSFHFFSSCSIYEINRTNKGIFALTKTGWGADNCFFLLSGMVLSNCLFLVFLVLQHTVQSLWSLPIQLLFHSL